MRRAQTRPAVSVAELQRAWAAVQTGAFRPAAPPLAHRPAAGPRAVEAVDSDGAADRLRAGRAPRRGGSSAPARRRSRWSVRWVRVGPRPWRWRWPPRTGGRPGWWSARRRRRRVWPRPRRPSSASRPGGCADDATAACLERSAHVLAGPAALALPLPAAPGTVRTVVDVSWEIGQLLGAGATSWLGEYLISGAASVVVATVATVPGMRRLEVVVDLLGADRVVAAVLGLPAKRWDTSLVSRAAPALRALGEAGRVVRVPPCRRLARTGLDTTPLPPELLRAAADLLELADASGRTLITQGGRR